ncbi:MAG: DnaA regulatory inactivator Hda [Gammaproteobacteria bacterium]|nr:DnaA regulatory inactivator Hda [Gammaproteobacteria bacterium]
MLGPKQNATLDNFIPGENSQALSEITACTREKQGSYLYLWGPGSSGKSHLMTAAAKAANENSHAVAYVPLAQAAELSPEMLANIEQMELVCLDDIHTIAGNSNWEEALFHLFNHAREQATNLIISANCGPSSLQIALPDLVSRLASGVSYRLIPLDDETKLYLLVDHANKRGMKLTPESANYILNNFSRDTESLLALLEQLDRASLAAQRKLTIPFIRSLIEQTNQP